MSVLFTHQLTATTPPPGLPPHTNILLPTELTHPTKTHSAILADTPDDMLVSSPKFAQHIDLHYTVYLLYDMLYYTVWSGYVHGQMYTLILI